MLVDIITIFPDVFKPYFGESMLRIAQEKGKLAIRVHDLRDYTLDKHRKVDDRPFGGGPGMVMSPEPIFRAVESLKRRTKSAKSKTKVILFCPQGETLDHKTASRLSRVEHLILICGHYEGVDERVCKSLVDEEISIGDYILTGGELAAMVLVDATARLIPGVLGHQDANDFESFSSGLLEYPQYTRPADFRKMKVPAVLLSGNHEKIKKWRKEQALSITKKRRPDLFKKQKINTIGGKKWIK